MPTFELLLGSGREAEAVHTITGDVHCTYEGCRSYERRTVLKVTYHDPGKVPDFYKYDFIENVIEGSL
jgi:hypothetical protein